jgi:hypothetical protein
VRPKSVEPDRQLAHDGRHLAIMGERILQALQLLRDDLFLDVSRRRRNMDVAIDVRIFKSRARGGRRIKGARSAPSLVALELLCGLRT